MKKISRHSGVTLIELMVSVAIGLVLAAAASYVYLVVQQSTRTLEAQASRNEISSLLLNIIGRDLKNAGFYPAHFPKETTNINFKGGFANIVNSTLPAFTQGIFGCSGAVFDAETGTCPTAASGASDSLVINYFADDTFARREQGLRTNCLRNSSEQTDLSGNFYNRARLNNSTTATFTTTVVLPILISNVYSLSNATSVTFYTDDPVTTSSLRCRANDSRGGGVGAIPPQPLVQGIDQLVIRYGLFDPNTVFSVQQFYSAAQVSNLPVVSVTKGPETTTFTGWQRVMTVQVCILTKTMDAKARQIANQGSYVDCFGSTRTYSGADRSIYKLENRIFAVRNNIPTTWNNL